MPPVSLVALFFFLRVAKPAPSTFREKIAKIDFSGNTIFIASTVSVLIGITWGGVVYPWSSYKVIVPLILGFVGLGLFVTYEGNICKNPSLPKEIIINRTAATVLAVTFLPTVAIYWSFYFMPIYYQAVKGQTSFKSGIKTLPLFAGIFPFAILGSSLLAKFGRYKPMQLFGMAILTISFGIFSVLDEGSPKAAWACSQLLFAIGGGLMIAILLPAVQAPLPKTLVALSIGVWTFIRGFGTVWGVTIPSAIFNNGCRIRAADLSDRNVASYLNTGKA